MDLMRKKWLQQADSYIRLISEKEALLVKLRAEHGSGYRAKQLDSEIKQLVEFYNQCEKMLEVNELMRLQLMLEKALLTEEIQELVMMLTQLRILSPDPVGFMEVIASVHESTSEITGEQMPLKHNRAFKGRVDAYYKKVMKIRKDTALINSTQYANS